MRGKERREKKEGNTRTEGKKEEGMRGERMKERERERERKGGEVESKKKYNKMHQSM